MHRLAAAVGEVEANVPRARTATFGPANARYAGGSVMPPEGLRISRRQARTPHDVAPNWMFRPVASVSDPKGQNLGAGLRVSAVPSCGRTL